MVTDRPLQVLIAGGGVAALEAALALKDLAGSRVSASLLAPARRFVYRPALVAEAFGHGVVHRFDLPALAAECGVGFEPGRLSSVDPEQRVVRLADGRVLGYDAVLIAVGARAVEAVPGAILLQDDTTSVRAAVADVCRRRGRRLVIAIPAGTTWALPAYELALLADQLGRDRRVALQVVLVTPEPQPLSVFGGDVSRTVASLLDERDIVLVTGTSPVAFSEGILSTAPAPGIPADRAIALPRLSGPNIPGLACDANGFLRTDAYCRIGGLADVFAAGDAAAFPVKQGGLAAQQAEVAARAIAADAGAHVESRPYEPVLRAVLVGGGEPRYLRSEISGGHGDTAVVSSGPPWWPPAKIAGRRLAPFLAERIAAEART